MRTSSSAVVVVAAGLLAPALAHADGSADEITFDAAKSAVKHVSVHFNDGAPRDLSIYGPAPLSSALVAAVKAQQNNVVYGYLDGLDIKSKEGTNVTLYLFPTGAADEPGFAQEFNDYFIGTLGGYADFAPGPLWTAASVGNVATDDGIPVTKALAKLGAHIAAMEKQGRAPSFQLGILLSKGTIHWKRFVLSTTGLVDDSPDRPLSEKLVTAPTDMVFTRMPPLVKHAFEPIRGRYFGPVLVTDDIKQTKGTVYLKIDAVDFAGKAGSSELYLANPERTEHGAIDVFDDLGAISNVAPGGRTPTNIVLEIHDFDSGGVAHRALTHLKQLHTAVIAVFDREGAPAIDHIVVTTKPD